MGEKRISQRTLDTGETVLHHPPDDAHPEGKQVLVRETSRLRDHLEGQLEENVRRHEAIKQHHTNQIAVKKQRQRDKGLPEEKSPI